MFLLLYVYVLVQLMSGFVHLSRRSRAYRRIFHVPFYFSTESQTLETILFLPFSVSALAREPLVHLPEPVPF